MEGFFNFKMKAEELRISNYVLSYNKDITQVIRLSKEKIIIDASPILLTEEWLLKFGFECFNYPYWRMLLTDGKQEDDEFFYIHFENNYIYLKCGYKAEYYVKSAKPIKYVHQLQNLYFALTGEELTIK